MVGASLYNSNSNSYRSSFFSESAVVSGRRSPRLQQHLQRQISCGACHGLLHCIEAPTHAPLRCAPHLLGHPHAKLSSSSFRQSASKRAGHHSLVRALGAWRRRAATSAAGATAEYYCINWFLLLCHHVHLFGRGGGGDSDSLRRIDRVPPRAINHELWRPAPDGARGLGVVGCNKHTVWSRPSERQRRRVEWRPERRGDAERRHI